MIKTCLSQIAILSISSNFFPQFIGFDITYSNDNLQISILMQKCKFDLENALSQKIEENGTKKITLEEILFIYLNILCGIEYLHGLQVIHTDLNPSNIFIVEGQRYRIRIGDLGFSQY